MAYEAHTNLLIELFRYSIEYMKLWVPLFIIYHLVKKYKDKILSDNIKETFYVKFLKLFAFGSKSELNEHLLDSKPELNTSSKNEFQRCASFLICFIGLQISYLTWGVMQERILKFSYVSVEDAKDTTHFKNTQFLVFCNRLFGFIISALILLICNRRSLASKLGVLKKLGRINEIAPLFICSYSSLSNVFSSWFQYEALKYVSFTTQLLAKSSKSVFVMVVGRIVSNKKYSYFEYACVMLIAVGLFLFSDVDQALKDSENVIENTMPGILCLIGYLLFDSFTSTWQDNLLKNYSMSSMSLMCITNFYSVFFTFISLWNSGHFFESISFMFEREDFTYHVFLLSCAAGIGQIFIFVTIEKFGALAFTLIMTTRQVFSIILSCIFFEHPLSARNILGTSIIFFSLFLQQFVKLRKNLKKKSQNFPAHR